MIPIYIGNYKDIKIRGNIRNIWRRYWNSDMIAGGKEQFVEAGKYKKEISIKKLAKAGMILLLVCLGGLYFSRHPNGFKKVMK